MAKLTVDLAEWPHGLRCLDCDMRLSMPYSRRLVAMRDHCPVVEIVCLACAVGIRG